MTRLPARGFKVGAATPQAKSAMVKKAMGGMQATGQPPAAPRRVVTNNRVRMAAKGTKLAPKLMHSTNPAHKDRKRGVGVAPGGPTLLQPSSLPGYPSV